VAVLREDVLPVRSEEHVVRVRQTVREWAGQLGLSLVEQTKVVTAASELARNTLVHGGGGQVRLQLVDESPKRGLRMVFEDEGPGIADLTLAMKDGYSTGGGLGLGLSGSRRLVPDFGIDSGPGRGTRVTITKWK
jgi:serine/threonine-protein kinase RsbT